MAKTLTQVLAGVATFYIAPAGTAAPALTKTGFTPATPWKTCGYTDGGVTMNVDRKTVDIRVEEITTPALVLNTSTTVTFDITFVQDTVANMMNAYGGGTITHTAVAGTIPAHTTLTLADALTVVAICMVGTSPGATAGSTPFPKGRLVYVPRLVSGGKVKTTYRRAKAARTYPATFSAICPMATIKITDVNA